MKKYLYLLLSIIGLCWTWHFNIQFFQTVEGASLGVFIDQLLTTYPGKSIGADIMIACFTAVVFMATEGQRLKMKSFWLLIPLSFLVAIAFTFPLFMFLRERKLELLAQQDGQ
ncbi:MAG: DUF2834 domain-containing protein [Aureispira sp.]